MVLRTGAIDLSKEKETFNIYYYMRSKNTQIFDNSVRAIVAATEIFQSRYDLVIDDLIEFYNKEIAIIEHETALSNVDGLDTAHYSNKKILSDERLNRLATAEIIKRTAHLVNATSFKKIFDFFITQGCLDQNE